MKLLNNRPVALVSLALTLLIIALGLTSISLTLVSVGEGTTLPLPDTTLAPDTTTPECDEMTTLEDSAGDITIQGSTTEEVTDEDITTEEVTTEDVTTEDVTTEEVTTEEVTTEEVTTAPVHVHSFGSWMQTRPSLCWQEGELVRLCSCGYVEKTTTPTIPHTPKTIPGYPSTCAERGKSDGSVCSVCSAVLKSQSPLPLASHNIVDGICLSCKKTTFEIVDISAEYAALYRADDLSLLFEKYSDKKLHPASLTKLVTSAVALRYMPEDATITVGSELSFVNAGSSLAWLVRGDRFTLRELLYGLMLPSGNDAAYTIAVNVARYESGNASMSDDEAVEYFVRLMNNLLSELGCQSTHFENPDGWDGEEHYTTVADLAIISKHALSLPTLRTVMGTPSIRILSRLGFVYDWKNSNFLIQSENEYYTPECIGMKTGSTDLAGKCLIAAFSVNGREFISVVVGCKEDDDRYISTLNLFKLIPPTDEETTSPDTTTDASSDSAVEDTTSPLSPEDSVDTLPEDSVDTLPEDEESVWAETDE